MCYYIGVDGGGTKTAYALFNEKKDLLATVYGPGSNHENLAGGFDEAATLIMDGISTLLDENKLSLDDITHTLMGLAGIDHPFQHEAICEELDDRGLKNYSIYNDGFIVTKAGAPGGVGIGYNCGTGTCCNSIDSRGEMLQIGGFGELSGDMGNGHWIAQMAFRTVFDEICLKKHESLLTKLFCKAFEIEPERDVFLATIAQIEGPMGEQSIRTLIDSFFEAAAANDGAVMAVIDLMAERGADYIAAHTKIQQFDGDVVNVVLSGSIHTKLPSGMYIDLLKKKAAEKSGRNINFIILKDAPVTGCINWMLEEK
ncbi:MAG: hypothetical protein LBS36_05025 [Oscillospiraceae bacterium]|jgi:N-acetylglucosamine kinase-like BadF-type ATPase|nr:hypothetical protein [Oscillospiraceae bacterium]